MKLMVILAICLLAFATLVFAGETTTTGPAFNSSTPSVNPIFNKYLNHTHEVYVDERDFEFGLGLDLILYKFGEEAKVMKDIKIETKYDAGNQEGQVYLVASVDLTKVIPFLQGGKK